MLSDYTSLSWRGIGTISRKGSLALKDALESIVRPRGVWMTSRSSEVVQEDKRSHSVGKQRGEEKADEEDVSCEGEM